MIKNTFYTGTYLKHVDNYSNTYLDLFIQNKGINENPIHELRSYFK
jgi:hypothetical protein